MDFTLKIWRQKNKESKGSFKTYAVQGISPDASFLEMLDWDPSGKTHEFLFFLWFKFFLVVRNKNEFRKNVLY